jgi:SAM-dependent methyltransferase
MNALEISQSAAIFDAEQAASTEDIDFFVDTAHTLGGPVLDLGCGAGRLAIPLARSGFDVVALDISAPLLNRLSEHLEEESEETAARIRMVQADMRRFALKTAFRTAICSSNTLFLLGSEEAVADALSCARSHLVPGGHIIIDAAAVTDEERAALARYPQGDIPDFDIIDERTGSRYRRTHSIASPITQAAADGHRIRITYRYMDAAGTLCAKRSEDAVLLTPDELLHLLRRQGYDIVDTFGWYDRSSFSIDKRKLIAIARSTERT